MTIKEVNLHIYDDRTNEWFRLNQFTEYELYDSEIVFRRRNDKRFSTVDEEKIFTYVNPVQARKAWEKFYTAYEHALDTGLDIFICL